MQIEPRHRIKMHVLSTGSSVPRKMYARRSQTSCDPHNRLWIGTLGVPPHLEINDMQICDFPSLTSSREHNLVNLRPQPREGEAIENHKEPASGWIWLLDMQRSGALMMSVILDLDIVNDEGADECLS